MPACCRGFFFPRVREIEGGKGYVNVREGGGGGDCGIGISLDSNECECGGGGRGRITWSRGNEA